MTSKYEDFWKHQSFALVANSSKKNFPELSYNELKKLGKTVFAIDSTLETIDGDKTYKDFNSLPGEVEAVVLELPKEETKEWMEKAHAAKIKNVWIHMGRDTKEALEFSNNNGMNTLYGTCAVMYLKKEFSYHSIHKWINQLLKIY